MKQFIIPPNCLKKYMGKENYYKFIKELKEGFKISEEMPIWIIGEYNG